MDTRKCKTYLSKHEITFSELYEEIFSSKSVIQLCLEVFDLDLCVGQLDQRRFILCCRISLSMPQDGTNKMVHTLNII